VRMCAAGSAAVSQRQLPPHIISLYTVELDLGLPASSYAVTGPGCGCGVSVGRQWLDNTDDRRSMGTRLPMTDIQPRRSN
jgi:hypothetical protein